MVTVQTLEKLQSQPHPLPRLIDTHVHLDDARFDPDRFDVIQQAQAAGVEMVLMSVRLEDAPRVLELARDHGASCAVGVHPNCAAWLDEQLETKLEALSRFPEVVAIGEIGLDYYRDRVAPPQQHEALRRQLALAVEVGLPVVLHNRESSEHLLSILKEFPAARGVFHSFMGDLAQAQAFLSRGFYLGIGGPLTFKANDSLRQTVSQLPLDRLLVETDSPYLTPAPHRGKRNQPAYVRYVAEMLSQIKGLSLEEVAQATTRNARALFGV